MGTVKKANCQYRSRRVSKPVEPEPRFLCLSRRRDTMSSGYENGEELVTRYYIYYTCVFFSEWFGSCSKNKNS